MSKTKKVKKGHKTLPPLARKFLVEQSNPVAKALNKAKAESQSLTDALKMYSMGKGEWDPGLARRISHRMSTAGMACELTWPEDHMPSDVRVEYNIVRGALSAVAATAGHWDPNQVVALERGLQAAEYISKKVPVDNMYQANEDAMRMELKALISLRESSG